MDARRNINQSRDQESADYHVSGWCWLIEIDRDWDAGLTLFLAWSEVCLKNTCLYMTCPMRISLVEGHVAELRREMLRFRPGGVKIGAKTKLLSEVRASTGDNRRHMSKPSWTTPTQILRPFICTSSRRSILFGTDDALSFYLWSLRWWTERNKARKLFEFRVLNKNFLLAVRYLKILPICIVVDAKYHESDPICLCGKRWSAVWR